MHSALVHKNYIYLSVLNMHSMWRLACGAAIVLAMVPAALSQQVLCPDLDVPAGGSVVIDCGSADAHQYRWTGKDPASLAWLSAVSAASPLFTAPAGFSGDLRYVRLSLDIAGRTVEQMPVVITVRPEPCAGCAADPQDVRVEEDLHLQCASSVVVESGRMAVIPCTGGGLLSYRAEFDWPPYRESVQWAEGAFDVVLRAPQIEPRAEVRMVELIAQDPQTDRSVSQVVEVHVVSSAVELICEDLQVEEHAVLEVPCTASEEVRYQILSVPRLIPPGVYDHLPVLEAPEVGADTEVTVTVRALAPMADRAVEQAFTLMVLDRPANWQIECDPTRREVYEATDDFEIVCRSVSGPTEELAWDWSALGGTPLELLEVDLVTLGRAVFRVPSDVEETQFYEFAVSATHSDLGPSNRVHIDITILEKPDIAVTCADALAHTGDPPLQLSCTAGNEQNLPLTYRWQWTPTERLLGDLSSGTPLFDVPADQVELTRQHVYEVTAVADDADAPAEPARLTVTVDKILGQLELDCAPTLDVFEGAPDVELDCTVGGLVSDDVALRWTWQPRDEGLYVNGGPPIFRTPASVERTRTYVYEVQVAARHYLDSMPQRVAVTVFKTPVLSLSCPAEITVNVGSPPQHLECAATHDQEVELDYRWHWDPAARLSRTDAAGVQFEVPSRQRSYSHTYRYTVTVEAEPAEPVSAPVAVTVLSPEAAGPLAQLVVSTSGLDLGVAGPEGHLRLDPATGQIAGLAYRGRSPHSGRVTLTTEDSVTIAFEPLPSVVLRRTGAAGTVTLTPQWAFSGSCGTLEARTLASRQTRIHMTAGDCAVLRLGGTVVLDNAEPGPYAGEVTVELTVGGIEELYWVPVALTVEPQQQAVVLGPAGARFQAAAAGEVEWAESISIYPQVAALGARRTEGVFEVANPSVHPMEVAVATGFGYREAQDTLEVSATATGDQLADLADQLSVYPNLLLLGPGETGQVRYALRDSLADRGHAAVFNFTATPRQYVRQDGSVAAPPAGRVTFQAPAVYVPGQGPGQLQATLEARTDREVRLLIETDTDPFYGQVVLLDDTGRELARSQILVYTRSRVRLRAAVVPPGSLTVRFRPNDPTHTVPSEIRIES